MHFKSMRANALLYAEQLKIMFFCSLLDFNEWTLLLLMLLLGLCIPKRLLRAHYAKSISDTCVWREIEREMEKK